MSDIYLTLIITQDTDVFSDKAVNPCFSSTWYTGRSIYTSDTTQEHQSLRINTVYSDGRNSLLKCCECYFWYMKYKFHLKQHLRISRTWLFYELKTVYFDVTNVLNVISKIYINPNTKLRFLNSPISNNLTILNRFTLIFTYSITSFNVITLRRGSPFYSVQ